jgi:hypothetical protein
VEDGNGKPLPGLAPVAMQQGRTAAHNIVRSLEGRPREDFVYRDRGSMATIGRGAAIAEIRGLKLSGVIAWLAWIFIHVFFLIGFRNRIAVMLEWAWAYLTWQRGARLITGPVGADLAPGSEPLGGTDRTDPSGRDDAIRSTPHPASRPPAADDMGSMAGDRDQARSE